MSFRIGPGQSVGDQFHVIAAHQFDTAIGHLRGASNDSLAVAVHEARKHCKRLRALFRLVRPSIPQRRYRTLDAAVRDAARELSSTRDAQALVDMFDVLVAAHEGDGVLGSDAVEAARAGLNDRVSADQPDVDGAVHPVVRAAERLELARDTAAATALDADGFNAVRSGLTSTYKQGRTALKRFRRDGTAEQSHEWRKAAKYTWHHLELLEGTAPSALIPAGKAFHQLADALGDAHNLAVLMETLQASPGRYGGTVAVELLVKMAEESRIDLEERAVRLGLRLYAESPGAFGRRFHGYWRAERKVGDELPTGELADLPRSLP